MPELTQSQTALPRQTSLLIASSAIFAALVLMIVSNPVGPISYVLVTIMVVFGVWKGWSATRRDPLWLGFMLMLFELLSACFFIPDNVRPVATYSLTLLFCYPAIPLVLRAWKGPSSGFKLYLIYFGWCLITVAWSVAPEYSIARLFRSVLLFGAVLLCSVRVREPSQMQRLVRNMMLAAIVVSLITAAAALLLPRSLTWSDLTALNGPSAPGADAAESDQIARFVGVFDNPSRLGELALVTMGLILTYFQFATRRQRMGLVAAAMLALALTAMADSRSALVALALGSSLYACWRYGWKGVLVALGAACVAVAALIIAGPALAPYVWRGDIQTVTGRAQMWPFVIQQIAERPLFGYGYSVAGAIFQSRYFPVWWGPFNDGVHSSIHDGYLSYMVGVGVPATFFSLFIVLRPWFIIFRHPEDPWCLKRMFFFIVIPILMVNIDEEMVTDCIGAAGLLFVMTWALAERYRLGLVQQAAFARRQAILDLPRAAAALSFSESAL